MQFQTEPTTPTRPVAATTPQPRCATPPKRSVKPQRKLSVTPTPKPQPKVMSSSATQTTPEKRDKLIPTGIYRSATLLLHIFWLCYKEVNLVDVISALWTQSL